MTIHQKETIFVPIHSIHPTLSLDLKLFLDEQVLLYNHKDFIEEDPISIPHQFSKKQDIEIIGFWVAILAWGNRKSIITNGNKLVELMEKSPHDFILNHSEKDRQRFEKFVHRTFNDTDSLYFLDFFQKWYTHSDSLEFAFTGGMSENAEHVGPGLIHFKNKFIQTVSPPPRTIKHISSPESNSRCKRILMFLRWMVRQDESGVDFGIWKDIKASQLLMPLDVHVERTARSLHLLKRTSLDWKSVLELTDRCRKLDPFDPVKYDFALFGLSKAQNLKGAFMNNLRNFS